MKKKLHCLKTGQMEYTQDRKKMGTSTASEPAETRINVSYFTVVICTQQNQ